MCSFCTCLLLLNVRQSIDQIINFKMWLWSATTTKHKKWHAKNMKCNEKKKQSDENKMLTHLNHTEYGDEYQSQFCHFFPWFRSFFFFSTVENLFNDFRCEKKRFFRGRDDVYEVTSESRLNETYRFAATLNNRVDCWNILYIFCNHHTFICTPVGMYVVLWAVVCKSKYILHICHINCEE